MLLILRLILILCIVSHTTAIAKPIKLRSTDTNNSDLRLKITQNGNSLGLKAYANKNLIKEKRNLSLNLVVREELEGQKLWLGNYKLELNRKGASKLTTLDLEFLNSNKLDLELELSTNDKEINNIYQLSLSTEENITQSTEIAEDYISIWSPLEFSVNQEAFSLSSKPDDQTYVVNLASSTKSKTKLIKDESLRIISNFDEINSIESVELFSDDYDEINQNQTITTLAGAAGPDGLAGPAGDPGPAGATGPDGPAGAAGAGEFTISNNANPVVSNGAGDYTSDDFVFGSSNTEDTGNADHDKRFFFDKSKAALGIGNTDTSHFNDGNRGFASLAVGYQVIASGANSFAVGRQQIVSGNSAIGVGWGADATADRAISLRSGDATATEAISLHSSGATATNAISIGYQNTASAINAINLSVPGVNNNNIANSIILGATDGIFVGPASGGSTLGSVGIGTMTPSQDLHIDGALRLAGQTNVPASASNGDFYYDDSGAFCIFVGGSWSKLAGAGTCS